MPIAGQPRDDGGASCSAGVYGDSEPRIESIPCSARLRREMAGTTPRRSESVMGRSRTWRKRPAPVWMGASTAVRSGPLRMKRPGDRSSSTISRTTSHTSGTRCHSSMSNGASAPANMASGSSRTAAACLGSSRRTIDLADREAVVVFPAPRIPASNTAGCTDMKHPVARPSAYEGRSWS